MDLCWMTKISEKNANLIGKILTVKEARKLQCPIVYGLMDDRGLFYVGQTKHAKNRFSAHLRGKTPNRQLSARVRRAASSLKVKILHVSPSDINAAEMQEVRSREGLVNLIGMPGYIPSDHHRVKKPWHGGLGTPSPGQWAMRKTGDKDNPALQDLLSAMSDAQRCGYELEILQSLHPIVQKRFSRWLEQVRDKMLGCLNAAIEIDAEEKTVC
jgi:hypothetical protein